MSGVFGALKIARGEACGTQAIKNIDVAAAIAPGVCVRTHACGDALLLLLPYHKAPTPPRQQCSPLALYAPARLVWSSRSSSVYVFVVFAPHCFFSVLVTKPLSSLWVPVVVPSPWLQGRFCCFCGLL